MSTEVAIQESPVGEADRKKIVAIQKKIVTESKKIRAEHPWLDKYQSWIGLAILAFSMIMMASVATLYLMGHISIWLSVPLIAFAMSIAHEIEHDTIHNAYFPKNQAMHNLIFSIVWFMRPGTVSPWSRKHIHLAHHRISGTNGDIEERAITNGEKMNLKRLIMMSDGFLSVIFRLDWSDMGRVKRRVTGVLKAFSPFGVIYYPIWWGFLLYHGAVIIAGFFGQNIAATGFMAEVMTVINAIVAIFVVPNFLRSFCLNFISSNMHYFGDIEKGNVVKQVQILDHWIFAPMHLFCFNFGKTHGLHHFWAMDPFYLRDPLARRVNAYMIENGVRRNDIGNIMRANRYAKSSAVSPIDSGAQTA